MCCQTMMVNISLYFIRTVFIYTFYLDEVLANTDVFILF